MAATNCLFEGNYATGDYDTPGTFAYNLNSNYSAPAGILVNKGKVVVEDSLFWGNRRSSSVQPVTRYPAPEDIDVRANGYLAMTNVFIASTYMGTDRRHCLQVADASHLTTNNIVTGDAMLISTTNEVAALNVHLRGGSGYCDENTGALVNAYRWSVVRADSPALDASPRKPILEPDPNGRRVNLGCYGNSPWATMSQGSGFFIRLR